MLMLILTLREEKALRRPSDGDAKEIADGTKVRHEKLGMEGASDITKERRAGSSEDNVIDVNKAICEGCTLFENKERSIRLGGNETNEMDIVRSIGTMPEVPA